MAGDPTKASIWAGADVYRAPVGTAGPSDTWTAWGVAWEAVGLLDGEEGFTEAREDEVAEHYAWGNVLVRRTKSKHQRTIRFVALEDNEITFELANPGSEETVGADVTTRIVRVPVSAEWAFGFETRDGEKVKRRIVDRGEITEVGETKDSETELTVLDMTVTLYPDATGDLYTELTGPATDPTP